MQSEEAHRIEVQVKELREQVLEFKTFPYSRAISAIFTGKRSFPICWDFCRKSTVFSWTNRRVSGSRRKRWSWNFGKA